MSNSARNGERVDRRFERRIRWIASDSSSVIVVLYLPFVHVNGVHPVSLAEHAVGIYRDEDGPGVRVYFLLFVTFLQVPQHGTFVQIRYRDHVFARLVLI